MTIPSLLENCQREIKIYCTLLKPLALLLAQVSFEKKRTCRDERRNEFVHDEIMSLFAYLPQAWCSIESTLNNQRFNFKLTKGKRFDFSA